MSKSNLRTRRDVMPPNLPASVEENLRRVMRKGRQVPAPTKVTKGSHPPTVPGGAINTAARGSGTHVTGYRGH